MSYTEAEYDLLFHKRVGQSRKIRDGVTREQAARMFKRKDAYWKAASVAPPWYGGSVRQVLDNMIADGFVHIIRAGRWMYLSQNADGDGYKPRLDSKIERDYIQVALNLGAFKKNY